MKILSLTAACLVVASLAQASPVTFGQSWDGNPPGTLATITGLSGFQTAPTFGAGSYTIDIEGGYTAWFGQDIVGVGTQTLCAGTCTQASTHTVTMADDWNFWATTPSYVHGDQFAVAQTSATTWTWGLEDIRLSQSDADFQDVFGTLTLLGTPIVVPQTIPMTPVPEPSFGWLLGLCLLTFLSVPRLYHSCTSVTSMGR